MKILPLILLLPVFCLSACSSSDDSAAPETPKASTEKVKTKISPDNPFSTQINALGTAKLVGKAAQESVDRNQKKLEAAQDMQP